MDAYGGFIFTCNDEEERKTLPHYIQTYNSCSVTMYNQELQLGTIELCLFSFDHKNIHYAALMRRSKQVASARYCLKFLKFVKINSIPLGSLKNIFSMYSIQTDLFSLEADISIEDYIIMTSNGSGKRIQPEVWQGTIAYLKQCSPQQAQDLDELERIRKLSHQRYSSIGFNVMKQEKEATLLALKLFGADYDNILASWFTQEENPESYLQGLEGHQRIREDDTIINDIFSSAGQIAPEMQLKKLKSSTRGLVRLKKSNGETLTIVNANRNKIEDTTGVDLVYYDHSYRSHVMVQYKMMEVELEQEPQSEDIPSKTTRNKQQKLNKKEFSYRPDKKFKDQIDRMNDLKQKSMEDSTVIEDSLSYRLNSNYFFFKLCESFEFEPISSDLAQGIYIPLDYMELLLQSPTTSGPRGGKRITYANVGRHFSNTLFMDLLQEGLIGSTPNASEKIYEEIHKSLSAGKSVTLAWKNLN